MIKDYSIFKYLIMLLLVTLIVACGEDEDEEVKPVNSNALTVADATVLAVDSTETDLPKYQFADESDEKLFYFAAEVDKYYAIKSTYVEFGRPIEIGDLLLKYSLISSDGLTEFAADDLSSQFSPSGLVIKAKETGNYFVKVKTDGMQSNTAEYQFQVDSYIGDSYSGNNTVEKAVSISAPTTLTGLVDLKYEKWFSFEVIADSQYQVKFTNTTCKGKDRSGFEFAVFKADKSTEIVKGAEVRTSHDCASGSFTATEDETVYLKLFQTNIPRWNETYDVELTLQ